jgi:hypothetical protein
MEPNAQRVQEALKSPYVAHVLKYRPDSCTAQLAREVQYMRELVMDAFNQACQDTTRGLVAEFKDFRFDHQCLSTYEEIQGALLERGLLKKEQCLRP